MSYEDYKRDLKYTGCISEYACTNLGVSSAHQNKKKQFLSLYVSKQFSRDSLHFLPNSGLHIFIYRTLESLMYEYSPPIEHEETFYQLTLGVIYKIKSITQLPIKQLLLKDISHHISQLRVSSRFYGAIFRMSFWKGIVTSWQCFVEYEISYYISNFIYNNNNNNNMYYLQLGCHPVAVVILRIHKYEKK